MDGIAGKKPMMPQTKNGKEIPIPITRAAIFTLVKRGELFFTSQPSKVLMVIAVRSYICLSKG